MIDGLIILGVVLLVVVPASIKWIGLFDRELGRDIPSLAIARALRRKGGRS